MPICGDPFNVTPLRHFLNNCSAGYTLNKENLEESFAALWLVWPEENTNKLYHSIHECSHASQNVANLIGDKFLANDYLEKASYHLAKFLEREKVQLLSELSPSREVTDTVSIWGESQTVLPPYSRKVYLVKNLLGGWFRHLKIVESTWIQFFRCLLAPVTFKGGGELGAITLKVNSILTDPSRWLAPSFLTS